VRKRVVVAVLAVLATVGTVAPVAPAGADTQATTEGRYAVGVHTETFVDASRPTSANNAYPGARTRTLVTTVWYPAAGTPGAPDQPNAPAYGHGASPSSSSPTASPPTGRSTAFSCAASPRPASWSPLRRSRCPTARPPGARDSSTT
jgi:hypothetical protein